MSDFQNPKTMAKALRQALAQRGIEFSHSECLEIVAHQFGLPDWNTMTVRLADQAPPDALKLPIGWFITGDGAHHYRIGLDPDQPATVLIASNTDEAGPETFGSLMQSVAAEGFRNRRIAFSATLSGEGIEGHGAIWMRIDGPKGERLCFENLMSRPREGSLSGDVGWTRRCIAFEVPAEAASVHFGMLLAGTGLLKARELNFGSADPDADIDGSMKPLPSDPSNLELKPGAN